MQTMLLMFLQEEYIKSKMESQVNFLNGMAGHHLTTLLYQMDVADYGLHNSEVILMVSYHCHILILQEEEIFVSTM